MIRAFLFAIAALLLLPGCGPARDPRPNVVLILGDDHGFPYFGFMDHPLVNTPHLDRLAAGGTLFTHGFTSSSECRRSLITLLTGLQPDQWNARVERLRQEGVDRGVFKEIVDFETLPGILSTSGYATFQGGKHWEGTYREAGFTHGMTVSKEPEDNPYTSSIEVAAGAQGLDLGRKTMEPLWTFVDGVGERPFMVWFAPMLPHVPHDAGRKHLRRYAVADLSAPARKYYANIARFDDLVGELVSGLETRGLRENTLLIYLSDNGWQQEPKATYVNAFIGGPRGKLSMYDLGFRTPIIFNWPARVPAGVRSDHLVSSADVFPTILDVAAVEERPGDLEGRSLWPTVTHEAPWSRRHVIGSMKKLRLDPGDPNYEAGKWLQDPYPAYFLRERDWRWIWYLNEDRVLLFDMKNDPDETTDVSARLPERAARGRERIQAWIDEMKAP